MENNSRGSEWRKWDLHVHTASSYDYKYKENDADNKLIAALRDNCISAVAITDHFVIDKDRIQNLCKLANDIVFFPGVELRTDKGDTNIHVILIFSEKSKLETLCEDFNVFKRDKGKNSDNNDKIYWDYNDIVEFAKKHDALISIHAGRKSNGVDDRITNALAINQATKEEYAKSIHVFEMGQTKDLDEYREHVFPNIEQIKPMVICSDNHNPAEYKCSLWIKADKTFEGLKQILYEPKEKERVRIQEENPKFDFDKSPFTEIDIKQDIKLFDKDDKGNDYKDENNISFSATTIPLNDNLVSIIGGRGTGKSRLIDYIAVNLGKAPTLTSTYTKSADVIVKRVTSLREEEKEFSLDADNPIPFMYISQSEVKEIVENDEDFTKKIRETIGISSSYSVNENNMTKANQLLDEYSNLMSSLYADNTTSEQKKADIEKQIKQNEGFIANVTSDENKQKLTDYKQALETLSDYQSKIERAEEVKNKIQKYQEELNAEIRGLNEQISTIIQNTNIQQLNHQQIINDIDKKIIEPLNQKIAELQKNIDETKNKFADYKGDLASLLENIQTYQNQVNELKDKKSKIENDENRVKEIITTELKQLGEKIKQDIEQYKAKIEEKWQSFISVKNNYSEEQKNLLNDVLGNIDKVASEKITLSVNIDFDKDKFYNCILKNLDKRSYKQEWLQDKFSINDYETYIDFINQDFSDKEFSSDTCLMEKLFNTLYKSYTKYIHHRIELLVNDKPLKNLSAGQKGTIYLRLQLAANLFSETIIYDQPEDDLDNKFINESLVELFKKIKKYRQVIIVSHNANLVVNADSEQVIVASNNDGVLSYCSGSLENKGINTKICEILEGGKEAFEKREKKYGL